MAIVAELGRLPEAGEFAGAAGVVERFGSEAVNIGDREYRKAGLTKK